MPYFMRITWRRRDAPTPILNGRHRRANSTYVRNVDVGSLPPSDPEGLAILNLGLARELIAFQVYQR